MILDQFRIEGKTALVTGAKRGIGKAIAIALAEAGADVIGVSTTLETGGSDPIISSSLHWPAIASGADDVELLENQLVKNQPGGHTDPSYAYPRMGEITYARFKGWNGPYTSSMPSSDPWSDKYLVNIQLLTAQGIQAEHEADNSFMPGTGQRAAHSRRSSAGSRRRR